jgi:SAM-dependent methyltransferase
MRRITSEPHPGVSIVGVTVLVRHRLVKYVASMKTKTTVRSNAEWQYWGRTDPLWAVSSWEGHAAGEKDAWTPERFLEVGRADWESIESHWRHFGMGGARCVEIGCGAGRMTAQLARSFRRVEAIDVSAEQIALAKRNLKGESARVSWYLVDDPVVPVPPGSCDGAFSAHVFQHLSDTEAVAQYFAQLRVAMRAGGTVCLHLPVRGAHRSTMRGRLPGPLRRLRLGLLRLLGKRRIMEYNVFDMTWVFRALEAAGFVDVELRIFPVASNRDEHSFFFARVPI